MTGNEKDSAFGSGFSAVANILLNALLIPKFDYTGAAIATTISVVMRNIILLTRVNQKIGIKTTPLGFV
jgi:O-antigen/teichoic acid export membrane protein